MAAETISRAQQGETERIWDPIVRITHWVIALAIVLNGLIDEGGSLVHIWIGYAALAMLVLRLLWGFVGPQEARFTTFLPSMSGARTHLGDLKAGRHRRYRSHNPLGSLMVYALWATLAVIIVTGLMQEGTLFPPTTTEVSESHSVASQASESRSVETGDHRDEGGIAKEIHEVAANLILILAALHLGGVVVESRLSRTNLARQMITGRRPV
ncbi:cytochrome b/b6 domain-containing protein [Amorphus sp. 3PC139-8]|uniref:cytochrome b/b6 domain-containing protein n=1 Tax=Amorphus sp. 3PC139-8 TaxID=2735676 RepID=UPI00345D0D9B